MIPRRNRLRHMKDFDLLFSQGLFLRGAFVGLRFLRIDVDQYPRFSELHSSLIGFVVSKKVEKGAVKRNLIKRRLRSCVLTYLPFSSVAPGFLIAVTAFPQARHATYQELCQDVARLFQKAGLVT